MEDAAGVLTAIHHNFEQPHKLLVRGPVFRLNGRISFCDACQGITHLLVVLVEVSLYGGLVSAGWEGSPGRGHVQDSTIHGRGVEKEAKVDRIGEAGVFVLPIDGYPNHTSAHWNQAVLGYDSSGAGLVADQGLDAEWQPLPCPNNSHEELGCYRAQRGVGGGIHVACAA